MNGTLHVALADLRFKIDTLKKLRKLNIKCKVEPIFCCQLNRKKGKKEGKKGKKESVLKDAIANAKLWETKLDAMEKSRQEYR